MKYMMSTKELTRLAVIKSAIDGACTAKQAAKKLGISTRWVKALKKAVREEGDGAVIHGNAGRHPANATDEGIRKKIIALKKSDAYQKANFTHFRELLEEYEQIKISCTGLSCILKGAGIASPKTRRSAGERRTMRERRAKLGELVQTDATPFDWFGLGVQYALHGFQDDATGDILGLYLCEHECLQGYFKAERRPPSFLPVTSYFFERLGERVVHQAVIVGGKRAFLYNDVRFSGGGGRAFRQMFCRAASPYRHDTRLRPGRMFRSGAANRRLPLFRLALSGEAYAPAFGVKADYPELQQIARLDDIHRVLDIAVAQLRDVDERRFLYAEVDEGAKVDDILYLAGNRHALF
jgi:transposase